MAPPNPVSVLPRFIAIKGGNGMYLALKSDGLLTFDAPQITHLATHEVLYNQDDPNATFIIRGPNQRFWRRDATNWIRADGAVENPPSAADTSARFKLAQLESGKLAFRSAVDDLYLKSFIKIQTLFGYSALERTPDEWSIVEVNDAREQAIILPRYIFIKGDNDKYMHTSNTAIGDFLKFHGGDPANLYGTSEVIPLLDGSLAFFSPQTNRCWRNASGDSAIGTIGSILTDASRDDAQTDTRCHFWPIKLSARMVALRSKFNNLICKRLTGEFWWWDDLWGNGLTAAASSTTDIQSHLTVSEAATGRSVFDVNYLLKLASTTEQMPLSVAYGSAVNNSSFMTDMTVRATVTQDVSSSYTFSNSFTFSQTVSTSFEAGLPFLAEGKVDVTIGFEQSFSKQWQETTSKGLEFNTDFVVKDVPPGGQASVTIVCSTAKMRIPFTYKCKEFAPDGTDRPIQEFVDGIFEGVDAYKIEAIISNSTSTYVEPT